MSPNVLGVAGSLRHDSWNRRLLGALAELAGDDLRLTVYDGLEQIPLFNEDAEEPTPPGVRQLHEAVRGADGLLIATPEYNQSMPGVLKNADRKSTRLNSSHLVISYAVFCLKKKKNKIINKFI